MRLEGKVAVVTGGGSGIGRATCLLFAANGAALVVADQRADDAQATVASIDEQGGPPAQAAAVDVASEAEVAELGRACRASHGRVDVLVNNAGARVYGPVTAADADSWALIVGVNLVGAAWCCKHLIPLMTAGGSVVNVSSANAVAGRSGMAQYDATKAGLLGLTRSMACDHAEQGVRVNAVLPGPTLTDFHLRRAREAGRQLDDRVTRPHPDGPGILRRQAHPEEIAQAVLFLASDAASYVTGACVPVDGGLTALAQRN